MVHKECDCQSAVLCTCSDKITYVLGDLDLLCCERKKSATNANLEDWRMTQHDPAGTVEMKPPEVRIYEIEYYV